MGKTSTGIQRAIGRFCRSYFARFEIEEHEGVFSLTVDTKKGCFSIAFHMTIIMIVSASIFFYFRNLFPPVGSAIIIGFFALLAIAFVVGGYCSSKETILEAKPDRGVLTIVRDQLEFEISDVTKIELRIVPQIQDSVSSELLLFVRSRVEPIELCSFLERMGSRPVTRYCEKVGVKFEVTSGSSYMDPSNGDSVRAAE